MNERSEVKTKHWLQSTECTAGVAAAIWLQVVGVVTDSVLHHILHALPIIVLLPLRRTRIVRFTSIVLALMWILMLAGITPMIYDSLIMGLLFSQEPPAYTWLAPIMAVICGIWAALNISLLRSTFRGYAWLIVGGSLLLIPVALTHPLLNMALEIPGDRTEQGEYIWAAILALEVVVLLAIPWLLAIRLTGIGRSEFNRRVIGSQIGYWIFFVLCMVAGLLPVFNT